MFLKKSISNLLIVILGLGIASSLVACSKRPSLLENYQSSGKLPNDLSLMSFCDPFYLQNAHLPFDWWGFTENLYEGKGTYSWSPTYQSLEVTIVNFVENYNYHDDTNVVRNKLFKLYEMGSRFFNAQNMISYKSSSVSNQVSFFNLDINSGFNENRFSQKLQKLLVDQNQFIISYHRARQDICRSSGLNFYEDVVRDKNTLKIVSKVDVDKLSRDLNNLIFGYKNNLSEVNRLWFQKEREDNEFGQLHYSPQVIPECKEYKTSNPKYVIVKCENVP